MLLDLPHDDPAQNFVLLLDQLRLGSRKVAQLHCGQRSGDLVVFLEQLVVDQLQLVEALPVIAELVLRLGQFRTHAVQTGLKAGNDLLFFLGVARHPVHLRGGFGQLQLKLAVGVNEIGRFFQCRLRFRRLFLGLIASGNELSALRFEFGHANGKSLRFGFCLLCLLDRLVAGSSQSPALGFQFLAPRLRLPGAHAEFLKLLGALGEASAQCLLLEVGRGNRSLQLLGRRGEFVDFLLP